MAGAMLRCLRLGVLAAGPLLGAALPSGVQAETPDVGKDGFVSWATTHAGDLPIYSGFANQAADVIVCLRDDGVGPAAIELAFPTAQPPVASVVVIRGGCAYVAARTDVVIKNNEKRCSDAGGKESSTGCNARGVFKVIRK